MKQVVQAVSGGPVQVLDVPAPVVGPTEVLVRTAASIVSPGTERAVTALARSSLLRKARERPDLVRQVLRRAREDGPAAAAGAVRTRLAGDVPLGYSAAGTVIEVGEMVAGIAPGQLVATGGAGFANHAEAQAVPGMLCVPVPDGVGAPAAAFATVASIALHGFRLADVGPGSRVVVVGLGLVGQIAARIARASGCEVAGIDVAEMPLAAARRAGALALAEEGEATTARVEAWSRGRGADAVLVCAATRTSDLMARVPALARDRAPVVVVGDVGLELDRTPFYEKELSVRFARSYGPGRYERPYEEWGVDYPAGQVRWTEGRNMEAVLDLLATGRLVLDDLVTHTFAVEDAVKAYELVETRSEPYLAIRFDYDTARPLAGSVELRPARTAAPATSTRGSRPVGELGVGWVGAGAFSSAVLHPALRAAGFETFVAVASAGGLSARRFGERADFTRAVSDANAVVDDPEVDVVVVATPHDSHALIAARALAAGRHVWCEKPAAISVAELGEIDCALAGSNAVLAVGLNRRFSPAARIAREHLDRRGGPLTLIYRVAAGPVPDGHWYADRRQGGRLLGEVCHFVDTCMYLNPSPVVDVAATAARGGRESLLADDVTVVLTHADGSSSVVVYSSARPAGVHKERIEALAGDIHLVVDDFREVTAGGSVLWRGRQDKGHTAAVEAFRDRVLAVGAGGPAGPPADDPLASCRVMLAAAAALGRTAGAPSSPLHEAQEPRAPQQPTETRSARRAAKREGAAR